MKPAHKFGFLQNFRPSTHRQFTKKNSWLYLNASCRKDRIILKVIRFVLAVNGLIHSYNFVSTINYEFDVNYIDKRRYQ